MQRFLRHRKKNKVAICEGTFQEGLARKEIVQQGGRQESFRISGNQALFCIEPELSYPLAFQPLKSVPGLAFLLFQSCCSCCCFCSYSFFAITCDQCVLRQFWNSPLDGAD